MRVLVTRPPPAGEVTSRRLATMGHEPVLLPLLEIAPTEAALPPGPFDAIAATSANAFLVCPDGAPPALAALPLHAVGAKTADVARRAGFSTVSEGGGDAAALAAHLAAALPVGARVLYLAGVVRKPLLEDALRAAGIQVTTIEVYEARAAAVDLGPALVGATSQGGDPAVLHYSRRSAAAFVAAARAGGHDAAMVRLPHLCLSADVAEPLRAAGAAAVHVAARPDEDALLALLANLAGAASP